MNIDDALEAMDEILDKSMQVPFSQKKGMVDVGALRDLIDDIRMNMPTEVTQAGTPSGGKSRKACFPAGDYEAGQRKGHPNPHQRTDQVHRALQLHQRICGLHAYKS